MHENHHDPSDHELERCMDQFCQREGAAVPSFDDIIARKPGRREPLLNRRTVALLACVMLLGATIWWQGNDNPLGTPVAEESDHLPGPELLDFDGCFAAIDQHFRSTDVEPELSLWSTPSDTLLTMNIQTNHGVLDNVEN